MSEEKSWLTEAVLSLAVTLSNFNGDSFIHKFLLVHARRESGKFTKFASRGLKSRFFSFF